MRYLGVAVVCVVMVSMLGCDGRERPDDDAQQSPAVIDSQRSSVVVDRASVIADGTDAALVTVTLRDADGAPVPGRTIEIAVSGSANLFTPAGPTDANGVTTTSVASLAVGMKVITATATGSEPVMLADAPAVQFTPGPPAKLFFVTQPTPTIAGGVVSPAIDLRMEDAFGHPLDDVAGTLSVKLDANPVHATASGTMTAAFVAGVATFSNLTVTRPAQALRLVATSSLGPSAVSEPFDVLPGTPSALSSLVISPGPAAANGSHALGIVATIRNEFGTPIPDLPVDLQVSGTGNKLIRANTTTDAFGRVTATLASTVAETKTVTATTGLVVLTGAATFVPPTCTAAAFTGLPIQFLPTNIESSFITDIDGDGLRDVAVTSYNQVSVMTGNGDGTFDAPVAYVAPNGLFFGALTGGDFDLDGDVDLVVGAAQALFIYVNDGTGSFPTRVQIPIVGSVGAFVTADFNGDGAVDLAFRSSNEIATLLGNGDGTFQAPTRYDLGFGSTSILSTTLAVADVDGKGSLDLLSVGSNNRLSVLLGAGSGAFDPPATFTLAYYWGSVAIGDFDGDDKLDVISPDSGTQFLKGNGDGTFAPQRLLEPTASASGWHALAVDFNADGKLDLVVYSGGYLSNWISVRLGNGDGTFQPARRFGAIGPGEQVSTLAISDLNGDGYVDTVVGRRSGGSSQKFELGVILGAADRLLSPEVFGIAPSPGGARFEPYTGDFDGNGTLDFVAEQLASHQLGVQLRAPNGTLTPAPTVAGANGRVGAIGDFDNDGKLDVATFDGNVVRWLRGNGNGSLQNPVVSSVGAGATSMTAADLDDDGNLDLAIASYSSETLTIALGNGSGSFAAAVSYPLGNAPVHVVAHDLDGDGDLDLALALDYHYVTVLRGAGDGTFVRVGDNVLPRPNYIAIGDLNNDGTPDLAVADEQDQVSLLFGNGDASFDPEVAIDLDRHVSWVATMDADLDGKLDLVALAGFDLVLLRGQNNGTLAPPVLYHAGFERTLGVVGDFDGNGRVDVMLPHALDPGFVMITNRQCP